MQERYRDDLSIHPELDLELWLEAVSVDGPDKTLNIWYLKYYGRELADDLKCFDRWMLAIRFKHSNSRV
jgi:hypothetical protein